MFYSSKRVPSEFLLQPYTYTRLTLFAGSNEGVEILRVPAQFTDIPSTYQWNYTIPANAAVNNRSLTYKRGYVLGGSSSISTCQDSSYYGTGLYINTRRWHGVLPRRSR